ncbi:TetR/AcrR family transcriptional regulator [Stenotrophomonas rhizophila]|uniref:TetR family transcriptional regulator n=1 Tax=Stenotrophomonas rhizophila TaxID=216778 RepID=A0A498CIE5_9GAMM|nr:TetR/AcrR family transcriptional regulator [Stenotrophomonas rhizophila]KAB7632317.1 TetR family transcriptional regulator [Stenotrophomonas rhizophila]MBU2048961.1 TetR/AcrR family transcriptional regulator [Gammaproteobacteria bacterium]RLK56170.1 TetR family transcriptional regulator [Stenotrophomonas rhizophila]
MTLTPLSGAPAEDAAAARAEVQRQRILDAAQRCFIARGFHAGSISDIAAEAEISQGLMYRYFENKRALILALIERQLAYDQDAIGHMPAAADLVDGLLRCYQLWARGETLETRGNAIANVALYAEITAEAHRDPVIAEVLRRHDRQTSAAITAWLRQHDIARGRTPEEADLERRTILMRLLVEGLAMRAVRDPDVAADTVRALLTASIATVLGE